MWSVAGDSSPRSLQELPVKGLNTVILSAVQIHTHCMLHRQNGYIGRHGGVQTFDISCSAEIVTFPSFVVL